MSPAAAIAFDASVLINLHASGVGAEVLRAQQTPCVLTTMVAREMGYVAEPDAAPRRVMFDALAVEELVGDEFHQFRVFAQDLDDGEASVLAISGSRSYVVATDDLKATRVVAGRLPSTVVIGTPRLMRTWADASGADTESIRRALQAIQTDARYRPRHDVDQYDWWQDAAA